MARRRREHPPQSHDRWLVSYADFITLLFAFFTTLYAISVVDADKATHAKVRVMIQTVDSDTGETWGTVGASENVIEASWTALRDSVVYGILKKRGVISSQSKIGPTAGV